MLCVCVRTVLKAWRRPTLPRLKPEYHRRWRVSLPSSGWDRVLGPPLWPPGRQESPDVRDQASGIGGSASLGPVPGLRCVRVFVGGFAALIPDTCPLVSDDVCRWTRRGLISKGSKPIERLVRLSFTHCCASTCLLSTWWSSTALGETWY